MSTPSFSDRVVAKWNARPERVNRVVMTPEFRASLWAEHQTELPLQSLFGYPIVEQTSVLDGVEFVFVEDAEKESK